MSRTTSWAQMVVFTRTARNLPTHGVFRERQQERQDMHQSGYIEAVSPAFINIGVPQVNAFFLPRSAFWPWAPDSPSAWSWDGSNLAANVPLDEAYRSPTGHVDAAVVAGSCVLAVCYWSIIGPISC
jgi:hypothetical protein